MAGGITLTEQALEGLVLGPADPEGRWGARVRFEGIVRRMEGDQALRGIDYEAYASMASRVMSELVAEAEARWPGCACAVAHRTGEVAVGEASVVVEARSAHRAEAFEAARFLIDELKARVPIWKREHLPAAGGRPS